MLKSVANCAAVMAMFLVDEGARVCGECVARRRKWYAAVRCFEISRKNKRNVPDEGITAK